MKKKKVEKFCKEFNELIAQDELTVLEAHRMYCYAGMFESNLHFEFKDGKWFCVAGE